MATEFNPTNYPATQMSPAELDGDPWETYAKCKDVDPDVFFPPKGGSLAEAYWYCGNCAVRAMCLESALSPDITDNAGSRAALSVRDIASARKLAAKSMEVAIESVYRTQKVNMESGHQFKARQIAREGRAKRARPLKRA